MPAYQLACCAQDEQRVRYQVTFPQAAWLAHQSVQPLQTIVAHPDRRALRRSGMKIESRTHPYHHGINAAAMRRNPALLFGTPQAHEHEASATCVDARHRYCILFSRQRAKRRRFHSHFQ